MVGGVVVSVLVGAVGAILDFAVTESPYQHGVNLNTVGVILMIVGAVGVVLSVVFGMVGPTGSIGVAPSLMTAAATLSDARTATSDPRGTNCSKHSETEVMRWD